MEIEKSRGDPPFFQGFSYCCSQFQFSGGGGQFFKRAAYGWAMTTVADKTKNNDALYLTFIWGSHVSVDIHDGLFIDINILYVESSCV